MAFPSERRSKFQVLSHGSFVTGKFISLYLSGITLRPGFSQEELGFETGYHRTYISLLERGLRSPTLTTIFQLATALEVKLSEMIRRIESAK